LAQVPTETQTSLAEPIKNKKSLAEEKGNSSANLVMFSKISGRRKREFLYYPNDVFKNP
jgi:hypothetical protein